MTSSSITLTVTLSLPDWSDRAALILHDHNQLVKRSGPSVAEMQQVQASGEFPQLGDDDQDRVPGTGSVFDIAFRTAILDHAFCGLSVARYTRVMSHPYRAPPIPTKLPQPRRRRLSFGPGHARFPAEGDGVDFGQPAGSAAELDQCRPFSVIQLSHSERLFLPLSCHSFNH